MSSNFRAPPVADAPEHRAVARARRRAGRGRRCGAPALLVTLDGETGLEPYCLSASTTSTAITRYNLSALYAMAVAAVRSDRDPGAEPAETRADACEREDTVTVRLLLGPALCGWRRARRRFGRPAPKPPSRSGNPESYVVFGKRYQVLGTSEELPRARHRLVVWRCLPARRPPAACPSTCTRSRPRTRPLPIPTWVKVEPAQRQVAGAARQRPRPFVGDRVIDLSFAAAGALDVTGRGRPRSNSKPSRPSRPSPMPTAGRSPATPARCSRRAIAAVPTCSPSPPAARARCRGGRRRRSRWPRPQPNLAPGRSRPPPPPRPCRPRSTRTAVATPLPRPAEVSAALPLPADEPGAAAGRALEPRLAADSAGRSADQRAPGGLAPQPLAPLATAGTTSSGCSCSRRFW